MLMQRYTSVNNRCGTPATQLQVCLLEFRHWKDNTSFFHPEEPHAAQQERIGSSLCSKWKVERTDQGYCFVLQYIFNNIRNVRVKHTSLLHSRFSVCADSLLIPPSINFMSEYLFVHMYMVHCMAKRKKGYLLCGVKKPKFGNEPEVAVLMPFSCGEFFELRRNPAIASHFFPTFRLFLPVRLFTHTFSLFISSPRAYVCTLYM